MFAQPSAVNIDDEEVRNGVGLAHSVDTTAENRAAQKLKQQGREAFKRLMMQDVATDTEVVLNNNVPLLLWSAPASSASSESIAKDASSRVAAEVAVAQQNAFERHGMERFTIFPLAPHTEKLVEILKFSQSVFWPADEIDWSRDLASWKTLDDGERFFIRKILAFFAGSDEIVGMNLITRFLTEDERIVPKEAKHVYGFQLAMENVHSWVYSTAVELLITDPKEKWETFNALKTDPSIMAKAAWAMKWIDSAEHFAIRCIAFAIVEGVFFSGAFAAIHWLNKRGKMPGLSFSNELISRDENLHTETAVAVYEYQRDHGGELGMTVPESTVHEMMREAIEIETQFVTESVPIALIGMNNEQMTEHITSCGDDLLAKLGYNRMTDIISPFDWMSRLGLGKKTNFFENRVGAYHKANMTKAAIMSGVGATVDQSINALDGANGFGADIEF